MDTETAAILLSVVLNLTHISAESFAFKAQVGNRYTVGPRDEEIPRNRLNARLCRASRNFLETYPAFLAVTILVLILGVAGPLSRVGCCLYLAGRLLYLPIYALGVHWFRSISWNVATLGIVLIGAQAVFAFDA